MIQVIFRNLERSELVRENVIARLEAVTERFAHLQDSRIVVTLSMENSPRQAGPDLYTVKVHFHGGRYHGVTLEKSASNFYVALADVVHNLLERLNRASERDRVRSRSRARMARFYDVRLEKRAFAR